MRRVSTGDVWTDAMLLQAEERIAEARALAARRALLREARPPRRGARIWLGWLLLAAGDRLLGAVPGTRDVTSPGAALRASGSAGARPDGRAT